jgi:hypothetical protein
MNFTWQWFPLLPVWLALALATALLAVATYGSWLLRRKNVPRRWMLLLAALRVGMVALFLLILLRPVLSFPRRTALVPDLLVLVDTSQSMSQASAAGEGTRLDEVRRALQDSPALRRAAESHELRWFTFDRRAYPLETADWEQAQPSGDATLLAESLKSACEQVRLANAAAGVQGAPARALVVSDGQDQSAADAAAVARELGLSIDVLSPSAADGAAAVPVALVDVQAAPRVLLGSETALQATLRASAAADDCELVVEEDGRPIERRPVGPLAAGEEARVTITHRPEEAGLKRYVLRLVRGDAELGRPRAVNVQVADARHDVLLLEETWRWEFKHLRRLLEDDPSFSLTALLSRGGAATVQFGEPDRGVELGGFPRSPGELGGFDTLILGNVDPHAWPRGLTRHLYDAVVDEGKSLVVIAGPRLGEWTDQVDLTRLLPVDLSRESGLPLAGPIELRVTPEGKVLGWFALEPEADAAALAAAPLRLPPLDQVYPVLRKRPAATVLLETAGHTNDQGPLIVMAEQTVGRGRVLFIAADTLWRWQTLGPRSESGATLYAAYWQHALRALAPVEPTSSATRLWLRPERTAYRAGERVRLSAEWDSDAQQSAAVSAIVVLPDGRRLPLDLAAAQGDPGRLGAEFDVAAPGSYKIEAVARAEDARVVAEIATTIEVAPRAAEGDAAPVNAEALARLAAATGGRVIDPAAADGWLPAAPPAQEFVVRQQPFDAWRNFTLLGVLCVLLAGDWSLRLFRGYV